MYRGVQGQGSIISTSNTVSIFSSLFIAASILATSRSVYPRCFVNSSAFLPSLVSRRTLTGRTDTSTVASITLKSAGQMNLSEVNTAQSETFQLFGKFKITTDQIFYASPSGLSKAFVNLRPIVPGHVLVISTRVVARMEMLSDEEYVDLWQTVRLVQRVVETNYHSKDSNVAVQDGRIAGQSVPHVHVHILPRLANDFNRNDDIYDALQEWAPRDDLRQRILLEVPEDADRRDRTSEEMANEAKMYRDALM